MARTLYKSKVVLEFQQCLDRTDIFLSFYGLFLVNETEASRPLQYVVVKETGGNKRNKAAM